jgi:hypothetical protein
MIVLDSSPHSRICEAYDSSFFQHRCMGRERKAKVYKKQFFNVLLILNNMLFLFDINLHFKHKRQETTIRQYYSNTLPIGTNEKLLNIRRIKSEQLLTLCAYCTNIQAPTPRICTYYSPSYLLFIARVRPTMHYRDRRRRLSTSRIREAHDSSPLQLPRLCPTI